MSVNAFYVECKYGLEGIGLTSSPLLLITHKCVYRGKAQRQGMEPTITICTYVRIGIKSIGIYIK